MNLGEGFAFFYWHRRRFCFDMDLDFNGANRQCHSGWCGEQFCKQRRLVNP